MPTVIEGQLSVDWAGAIAVPVTRAVLRARLPASTVGGPRPLSRCSQRTRESAARNAARELRHHGISYLNGYMLSSRDDEPGISWLADIAQHIDSLDPIEIGAAALLEAQGYQRTNVQLALDQEADQP